VGDHEINPPLNAPATSEEILDAIAFVEAARA
jgi:xanthine dehydrogenase large subunit